MADAKRKAEPCQEEQAGVPKAPRRAVPHLLFLAETKTPNGQALQACLSELTGKATWQLGNSRSDFQDECQLREVDVIVLGTGGKPDVITELWPLCPKVRWVHSMHAGVDKLVPAMNALPRGPETPLTNAKGAFSRSLAEYSLAAMLHFNKQISRLQSNRAKKAWEKFVMAELHGQTVGFIGFGDIAQTTARICKAFGMRIVALRQTRGTSGSDLADEVIYADRDAPSAKRRIFSEADYIICGLPGGAATYRFCGEAEFSAMKPTGVFISIGRGSCVDEVALHQVLTARKIAGAALDVFDKEPLQQESPLWECENLLLSPHTADYTSDMIELSWEVFRKKLGQFSAPDFASFDAVVDKTKGY